MHLLLEEKTENYRLEQSELDKHQASLEKGETKYSQLLKTLRDESSEFQTSQSSETLKVKDAVTQVGDQLKDTNASKQKYSSKIKGLDQREIEIESNRFELFIIEKEMNEEMRMNLDKLKELLERQSSARIQLNQL